MFLKSLLLTSALIVGSASAAVVNGSFESGLTGWQSLGASTANPPNLYLSTATATDGVTSARLQVYDFFPIAASTSQISTFVGDTSGTGQYVGNAGSAIKQTINLNAGDVISFDWRFGKELPKPSQATLPFFVLNGVQSLLLDPSDPMQYMRDPNAPQFFFSLPNSGLAIITSWQTVNIPITFAGAFTLAFGETGTASSNLSDQLFIDNVRLSANVPEPGGIALLGLGALGLIASRRRKFMR